MSDITTQSLTSLVKNIKEKKLSSEEVTKAFIDRSEKSKELNSYISEDFSNAIDNARIDSQEDIAQLRANINLKKLDAQGKGPGFQYKNAK